ncbi:flagellar biosynthesis protein FlgN [Neorhodopirellula pilleata]|uniref:FlgN protein n=1 Tax=Neorhodopirellula pilleata TaxID=2714738 RepID=A0A5C6ABV5_9BACT|nr:flagellar biosynthesis protein FlgN [Neorhodopirellula pilleata]TWT96551.1 hypothetical protein Pla100_30340 [Neorhodopirellula pilleata]
MASIEDLQRGIDLRHEQLTTLLQLTDRQETAIASGHMNELMSVLGEKQRAVEAFVKTSETLKLDRDTFADRPAISDAHRARNDECLRMHEELLRREAACQSALETSRDEIAGELARGEGARRAAAGYGQANRPDRGQGGGLDLSNDG